MRCLVDVTVTVVDCRVVLVVFLCVGVVSLALDHDIYLVQVGYEGGPDIIRKRQANAFVQIEVKRDRDNWWYFEPPVQVLQKWYFQVTVSTSEVQKYKSTHIFLICLQKRRQALMLMLFSILSSSFRAT